MTASKILADYRGDNVQDYSTSNIKGYVFIDTAGHGYLCLGSADNGYSEALQIARSSNYSFILEGGLVFLEEDCDMGRFLDLGMDNRSKVLANDFMESMGIHVVRIN